MLIELARRISNATWMLAVGDIGPVPGCATLKWDQQFESAFLQRRVMSEPRAVEQAGKSAVTHCGGLNRSEPELTGVDKHAGVTARQTTRLNPQ
jgi:hypothetical protein